jgi:hypothetical protein
VRPRRPPGALHRLDRRRRTSTQGDGVARLVNGTMTSLLELPPPHAITRGYASPCCPLFCHSSDALTKKTEGACDGGRRKSLGATTLLRPAISSIYSTSPRSIDAPPPW